MPSAPPDAPARAYTLDEDGVLAWAEQQAETLQRRGQIETIVIAAIDPEVDVWVAGRNLSAAQGSNVLALLCRSFQTAFPTWRASLKLYQPYPDVLTQRDCEPGSG